MGRLISSLPRYAYGLLALSAALAPLGARACEADDPLPTIRYNEGSDRLYLEGSGCITPRDIYAAKNGTTNPLPIKAITEDGEESEEETG